MACKLTSPDLQKPKTTTIRCDVRLKLTGKEMGKMLGNDVKRLKDIDLC